MGTILASKIITDASTILQEEGLDWWQSAECLLWLNIGQRYIVQAHPEANLTTEAIALTTSSPKVSLPAGGYQLVTVTRNMGTGGATHGEFIRQITFEEMDTLLPGWMDTTQAPTTGPVELFLFDPRNPKVFYVYPAMTSAWYVEIVYAKTPTDIASTATAISLDDIWEPVLLDYLLYRAYSKHISDGSAEKAAMHLSMVNQAIGNVDTKQARIGPSLPSVRRERVEIGGR